MLCGRGAPENGIVYVKVDIIAQTFIYGVNDWSELYRGVGNPPQASDNTPETFDNPPSQPTTGLFFVVQILKTVKNR